MEPSMFQESPNTPVFSIGIKIRKSNKKSKKRKAIKTKNPVYSTVKSETEFKIYEGSRWKIPLNIHVSNTIQAKFQSLETVQTYKEIQFRIHDSIKNMKFKFNVSSEWKAPAYVNSIIQSFYAKQENEWNKVRGIYFRLFKTRKLLKPLVFRWRVSNCLRHVKNTEDIGTLEIPIKPVYVIDFTKRISFLYEASTLRRSIESSILYSEFMFPEPKVPINLLTNEPFTYSQMISVVKQCKKYGEYSWILDSLWKHDFNISMFKIFYKQQLKLEAINTHFKKSANCIRDEVIDHFIYEAELIDMPSNRQNEFIHLYNSNPEHELVKLWIQNTKEYYITKELHDFSLIIKTRVKTEYLLNRIYNIFIVG
jgi:hypothetical protein